MIRAVAKFVLYKVPCNNASKIAMAADNGP